MTGVTHVTGLYYATGVAHVTGLYYDWCDT